MQNSFLNNLVANSEMDEVIFQQFRTEMAEDQKEVSSVLDLLAGLESISELSDGSNPELVQLAANTLLAKYEVDPIEEVSMESVDSELEYAQESIGELITKLKDWIAGKFKKMGEKWAKFKKAMSYAFSNQVERANAIIESMKADDYKAGPFPVKGNGFDLRFYQKKGKRIDAYKEFINISKTMEEIYSQKHITAVTDLLYKEKWRSLIEAQSSVGAATDLWLKLSRQKEGRLDGITPTAKNVVIFSVPPAIGGFVSFSTVKKKVLGDGKTKVNLLIGGGSMYDAPIVVAKAGFKSIDGLTKEEVIALCEVVKKTSLDQLENLASIATVYDDVDAIIEAVLAGVESSDMEGSDKRQVFNTIFPLVNRIINSTYGIWDFFHVASSEMIHYSKLHVK